MDHREVRHACVRVVVRTCVGCRCRAAQSDLLRVVAVEAGPGPSPALVPDLCGAAPGRGAYVHLDLGCFERAERRRAFPRALRRSGPLDTSAVRNYLEARGRGRDDAPAAGAQQHQRGRCRP